MNKIWNSVVFRKIVIIFIVGLVSRGVVNSVFEVNVFKDCTMLISLTYYALMACFTGFVGELSYISFNVFDIRFVSTAIKSFFGNVDPFLWNGDKVLMGTFTDNSNKVSGLSTDKITHYYFRKPSAGVIGLYDRESGRGSSVDYIAKHSVGNKLRCKLLWHSLIKYTENYGTYKEYINSFNPRFKVSIVDEVRRNRDFRKNR